jgi:glycosyltransferase involved in cell wall biosynthesis
MYHGNLAASMACSMAVKSPILAWNIRQSLYGLNSEKLITRQVIRSNRMLSKRPESIIYNSQVSRLQHEGFGFCSARGVVIPNGFDLDRFGPSVELRHSIRASFEIPMNSRVVGHIARLHPMKDHENFVHAAVIIAADFHDAHFLLVGRGVTPYHDTLQSIVPRDMQPRFHWIGERTDVADLMCAMDVFVLSSWAEGFPNVLGEAMACGVPCVATDVGDSAHLLDEHGRIVPPRDSDSLAAAVSELLCLDPHERVKLGLAARLHVETKYSISAIASQYTAMYSRLVKKTS